KQLKIIIIIPHTTKLFAGPCPPQLSIGYYFLTSLATASPKDKGGVHPTFIFRVLITNRLG
ncbi:MAG: hypothetical protein ACK59W_03105, partial [Pseudanabaena sp.]